MQNSVVWLRINAIMYTVNVLHVIVTVLISVNFQSRQGFVIFTTFPQHTDIVSEIRCTSKACIFYWQAYLTDKFLLLFSSVIFTLNGL